MVSDLHARPFSQRLLLSSCRAGAEAHGCGVLAVVADTDESFAVLVLAPDDGHWGALPVWVGTSLALDGDVVPGQSSVGVGFDDGLLNCESSDVIINKSQARQIWTK